MALSRPGSLLPSIKCSNCASEIAISMMGDHICIPIQESEPFSDPDFFGRDVASPFSANMRTSPQKSGRAQPLARIDSVGANKPFLGHDSPSNHSPIRAGSSQSSPFRPARDRLAQPMKKSHQGPPSPELSSNLDCAFPHFPSPSFETHNSSNKPGSNMNFINEGKSYSPWNKMSESRGASPGPFDVKIGGFMGKKENSPVKREQLKKAVTFDHEKPWKNYETSPDRDRRPSSAKDNRRPAIVNELPRTDTIDAFLTKLKEGAAPQPRRRADESKKSTDLGMQHSKQNPSTEIKMANVDEPVTLSGYPVYKPPTKANQPKQPENQSPRKPMHRRGLSSNPKHLPQKPSLSNVRSDQTKGQQRLPALPLPSFPVQKLSFSSISSPDTPTDSGSDDSIGSFDYQNGGFVSSPATSVGSSRSEKRSDYSSGEETTKLSSVKGLPRPVRGNPRPDPDVQFRLEAFAFERPRSPPQTNKHKKQGASVHFETPSETSSRPLKPLAPGFSKPQPARKLRDIISEKVISGDRSADPAIQAGLRRKRDMADTVLSALGKPAVSPNGIGGTVNNNAHPRFAPDSAPENPSLLTLPEKVSPALRSPPGVKSDCRGCGNAIIGKSVKAADGSLSGRFHKQCFVCKTCSSPFQTADFYVLNDSPYCKRHYHELNGSLCHICDQGIEGQYLETDERKKYHPRCFTCLDCPTVLEDDYFEVNGKAYCEPHAFRAASAAGAAGTAGASGGMGYGGMGGFGMAGNGFLGVDGSTTRVERRRTKLMMM